MALKLSLSTFLCFLYIRTVNLYGIFSHVPLAWHYKKAPLDELTAMPSTGLLPIVLALSIHDALSGAVMGCLGANPFIVL